MTTQEFVQKAIEGGWKWNHKCDNPNCDDIYLDPKAWQAVGRVDGWGGKDSYQYLGMRIDEYEFHMQRMIHWLCNGKSIDQFLETL